MKFHEFIRQCLPNLIVGVHVLTIFMSISGILVFFRRWLAATRFFVIWRWLFLATATTTALSVLLHRGCLLTTWEKRLRDWAEPGSSYEGTFVDQYLGTIPRPATDLLFLICSFLALVEACAVVVEICRKWKNGEGRT
jgi:hypothetical protein